MEDCNGIITAAKDNKIKVWSRELDLWGSLNCSTDHDDPKWSIPTKQVDINREKELAQLEDLIDNLELDIKGPRPKLVIDDSKLVKVVDEKNVTRIDWIKL